MATQAPVCILGLKVHRSGQEGHTHLATDGSGQPFGCTLATRPHGAPRDWTVPECLEAAKSALTPLLWSPPHVGKPVGAALRWLREAERLLEDA